MTQAMVGPGPTLPEGAIVQRILKGDYPDEVPLPLEGPFTHGWASVPWCASHLVIFRGSSETHGLVSLVEQGLSHRPRPWSGLAQVGMLHGAKVVWINLIFPGVTPARASLQAFRDTLALVSGLVDRGLQVSAAIGVPRSHHRLVGESLKDAMETTWSRLVQPRGRSGGLLTSGPPSSYSGSLGPQVCRLVEVIQDRQTEAVGPFFADLVKALDRTPVYPRHWVWEIRSLLEVLPPGEGEPSAQEILETSANRDDWLEVLEFRVRRHLQPDAPCLDPGRDGYCPPSFPYPSTRASSRPQ